ncbi:MAG: coproporphyrinogen III oxidase, partial [Microbacterium sp.]
AVRGRFGLTPDAEVTTEANPDSVTPDGLAELRAGGFTRISFGMQSAVPSVLAVLDRTHDPERVPQAVAWAREAGFEQISLDLIYGTPGESVTDWETSVRAALACGPDHVSAYSLIVEDGTAFARKVRTGVVPLPDEDDLADKYEVVDDLLTAAGLGWYEVSNWSRDEASRCRHNELYWRSENWLGVGPGAHAHVGGVRWWNARHPTAYAARLEAGESPALAREVLDDQTRRVERVLLEVRLRDGLPLELVDRARADAVVADGLAVVEAERLVLTRRGRLLADAVVRDLLG